MPVFAVDAVVVGGAHHGLVAAAVPADAGRDVLLLEAQPELGGAMRSTQWYPGFVADRFSAFYPVTAPSSGLFGTAQAADGRGGFLRRRITSAALALVHGPP